MQEHDVKKKLLFTDSNWIHHQETHFCTNLTCDLDCGPFSTESQVYVKGENNLLIKIKVIDLGFPDVFPESHIKHMWSLNN